MREARGWSQGDLAALVNMPQTAISRLESPNYGKATITTLKRMARVYDVGLEVKFVPFSALVDRVTKTPRIDMGLTSDSMAVADFAEEERAGAFQSDTSAAVRVPTLATNFIAAVPQYNAGMVGHLQYVAGVRGLPTGNFIGEQVNAGMYYVQAPKGDVIGYSQAVGYSVNAPKGTTKKPVESDWQWLPLPVQQMREGKKL
jgi:transcriptional regulator with XRE-family HTH domain